jgi:hypothetical protein
MIKVQVDRFKMDKLFKARVTALAIISLIVAIVVPNSFQSVEFANAERQANETGPVVVAPPQTGLNPGLSSSIDAPIATSGSNLYVAWPNNDTGHWNVFFAKSTDSGKSFRKIIILSAPNTGHIIDSNTQIAASGSDVYVTWWNNKTGVPEPLFRASNDNGDAFGRIIKLNSTSTTDGAVTKAARLSTGP